MIDASKSFVKDGNKNKLREKLYLLSRRLYSLEVTRINPEAPSGLQNRLNSKVYVKIAKSI